MTSHRLSHAASTVFILLLVGAVLAGTGCGAPEGSESSAAGSASGMEGGASANAWTPLFNGENLEGWRNPYDWGEAWVENDEIRLRSDEKFFLVTEDTYSDFVFETELKLPDRESNSGIMFRANVDSNRVYGYQAEADPTDRAFSGGLYDEGRRGWLYPTEGEPSGKKFRTTVGQAFNPDEWNHYRIRAQGDSLKIWVNGEQTTAYRDAEDSEGVIGLQHHGEDGKVYRFRNPRIRPLGNAGGTSAWSASTSSGGAPPNTLTEAEREAGWTLLFDGESLDGWTGLGADQIPEGHWVIEDGTIKKVESGQVPTAADGQPLEGGDIMTEETYEDYELKWEWKVAKGANSGLKYNVSEEMSTSHKPERAALGFEYQVLDDKRHPDGKEPSHRTGALYDMIPADPAKKNMRPPGEWNEARLVFRGNHGEHWLNGQKLLEYDLDSARFDSLLAASKYADVEGFADRRTGHLVLQDHGDTVWYRNIKLRKLPAQ